MAKLPASITPPDFYGIVEKGIYRSNILHPTNFSFLKTLSLKTVIVLSPEPPTRALSTLFDEAGIKVIHLGVQAWKPTLGWRPVSEELIKEGLEIILDVSYHPALIMCTSGLHETGILVGCLRKLQGWNFNSIVTEYRSFAGTKSRYVNEQFIELFDLDLVTLPMSLPQWFIRQQQLLREEEEELQNSLPQPDSHDSPRLLYLGGVPSRAASGPTTPRLFVKNAAGRKADKPKKSKTVEDSD
ncbi:tyrosine phosphatase family-domain-containing protein [Polychytrium aggregatum]|uniref:tyrosine phosphatase family-domain-containing protein n=1 Tax=Polychytrium aggregatum TaxID=110093 RepID=UPI0022FEAA49|nr:tyrosine phosphatase family-domain-containing protein [Polychytrium aggregatum]KAI9205644.1 tyrosine phosphatase family-domain-containing protein [Polychytrium aggregatum]